MQCWVDKAEKGAGCLLLCSAVCLNLCTRPAQHTDPKAHTQVTRLCEHQHLGLSLSPT
jgi:hypothetical protein